MPRDLRGKPLTRTNTAAGATSVSKLNDAYVENAGADHYLTDAFAAGHQIVRSVIGKVTEQFVKDKGGQDKFLDFVAVRIQQGAIADKSHATGDLGDFQEASKSGMTDKIARGGSWVNHLGIEGLKQKLRQKIDAQTLRSIGAKLVHDYYNRNGMIVHNQKGMPFMIKGDGHASEAPEMQKVIAVAVLESRHQVREMAESGATGNPLDVWAYTPQLDKTLVTMDSGREILAKMFDDSAYLWALIKDNFSAGDPPDTTRAREQSKYARGQQAVDRERVDVGTKPNLSTWLAKRHQYVRKVAQQPDEGARHHRQTVDGVTVPVDGA